MMHFFYRILYIRIVVGSALAMGDFHLAGKMYWIISRVVRPRASHPKATFFLQSVKARVIRDVVLRHVSIA